MVAQIWATLYSTSLIPTSILDINPSQNIEGIYSEYVNRYQVNELTNGIWLNFGLYENYQASESVFTAKPLVTGASIFGKGQTELQLQVGDGNGSFGNVYCTRK